MIKNKLELKFKMKEATWVCYSFYEDDKQKPGFIVVSEGEIKQAISILEEKAFVCERYGNRTASYLIDGFSIRTQLAEDGGGFRPGYNIRVFSDPKKSLAGITRLLELPYNHKINPSENKKT